MSSHFAQAVHRASVWVADVATALGTRDRNFARRVLRAWLHTLRDRLTVDATAKFGQQLPELLRGMYYDGWEPSRVPMRYNQAEYVQRFAAEARVEPRDVPQLAAAVTHVISEHMSPGQVSGPPSRTGPRSPSGSSLGHQRLRLRSTIGSRP